MKKVAQMALLMLGLANPLEAVSVSWTGAVSNAWNTAANWSPASVPMAGDQAFFAGSPPNSCNISVAPANVSIFMDATYTGTLTVGALSTFTGLDIMGGTYIQTAAGVTVAGNFNYTGGSATFNAGTGMSVSMNFNATGPSLIHNGSLSLNSGGAVTLNCMGALNSLTLNKAAGMVTLLTPLVINGNLTVQGTGSYDTNGYSISVLGNYNQSSGTFNQDSASLIAINGNFSQSAGVFSSPSNAVLRFQGGNAQSLSAVSAIGRLVVAKSGGTLTQSSAITTAGDFEMQSGTYAVGNNPLSVGQDFLQSGGTFNHGGNTTTLYEDFIVSGGTFNPSAGTLVFSGSVSAVYDCAFGVNNVTVNKPVATLLQAGVFNCGGNFNLQAGTFDSNFFNTFTGPFTQSGGGTFIGHGGGKLRVTGGFTAGAGGYVHNGGEVEFFGGANATLNSVPSFHTLTFNKSGGTLSSTQAVMVSGNYTHFNLGTLDMGIYPMSVQGAYSQNFGAYSGTSTLNVAGNFTLSGAPSFNGTQLNLNGSGTQNFSASVALNNVDINSIGGSVVQGSAITVNGGLNLSSGTYDLNGFTLTSEGDINTYGGSLQAGWADIYVAGTFDLAPGTFAAGFGTVHMDGIAQSINANLNGLNHLSIENSGADVVLASDLQLGGNLDILAGASLNDSGFVITLAGDWSNSGAFTASGGVEFTGPVQYVMGNSTFNDFTKIGPASSTLYFQDGSTQTISGILALQGPGPGQEIQMDSSSGVNWNIQAMGTVICERVNPLNSTALGSSITCVDCIDGGANINWIFSASTATPTPTPIPTACGCAVISGNPGVGSNSLPSFGGYIHTNRYPLPLGSNYWLKDIQVYVRASSGGMINAAVYQGAGMNHAIYAQATPQVATLGWNSFDIPDTLAFGGGDILIALMVDPGVEIAMEPWASGMQNQISQFSYLMGPFPSPVLSTDLGGNPYLYSAYVNACPETCLSPTPTVTPSYSPTPACGLGESLAWTFRSPNPGIGRGSAAGAVALGKLHVFGGSDASSAYQNHEAYDPLLDAWTAPAAVPSALRGMGATEMGGKIYLAGGSSSSGAIFNGLDDNFFYDYDPLLDFYNPLLPLPTARRWPGVAGLYGKVWVVGGGQAPGNYLGVVEAYQPGGAGWSTGYAALSPGRMRFALAAVNGKLYAIGGQTTGGVPIANVDEYDPLTNTWTARMPMPTARYGMGVAVQDGVIYVMGGHDGTADTPAVQAYTPAWNSWAMLAGVNAARVDAVGGAINGKLYLALGFAVTTLEEAARSCTLPSPTSSPSSSPSWTATHSSSATPTLTATPSPTATASATPCALLVSAPLSLPAGSHTYCYVEVMTGATLTLQDGASLHSTGAMNVSGTVAVQGSAQILVDLNLTTHSGGLINGNFSGFAAGPIASPASGPGAGGAGSPSQGGGGGGYGGQGGNGGAAANGGVSYGDPAAPPYQAGSGGGGGVSLAGSGGGAAININVTGQALLNGPIYMNGGNAGVIAGGINSSAGGAGAGGGIFIVADSIIVNSFLQARGGNGGGFSSCPTGPCLGGGGGAGGRINLCATTLLDVNVMPNINGGSGGAGSVPGQGGQGGTYYECSVNMVPTVTATSTYTKTATATPSVTPSISPTSSDSATSSVTPSVTPSISPTSSSSESPTATLTASPTMTASPTRSATPSATETATSSVTPSATPTGTPSATPSVTPSVTPSISPTSSSSATPSVTPSATPSISPTSSSSATLTATPSVTPSISPTSSDSATPSVTPSVTPSISPTSSSSATLTVTPSVTPSISPTSSSSATLTATPSVTPSTSPTSSSSATMTVTPSVTPSVSPTSSSSATLTVTPSVTPSISPTSSSSATLTATPSVTPSLSPSFTRSVTPSASPSVTPSISPTSSSSATLTASPSVTPSLSPSYTYSATSTATLSATPSVSPSASASATMASSPTQSATLSASPTQTATALPSSTVTPPATPTASPTISMTYTITDTPTITATAAVPAVLSSNVLKPEQGGQVSASFKAPQAGRVTVKVYNMAAELVRTPFEADVFADTWIQAVWDGRNNDGQVVGSGVYFVSVRGAGLKVVLKVIVVK